MTFQIEHLRTLIRLVDEGTFEAAARRLHVTASAVSQRVRTMEQTAGKVLVQRTNPVRTTAAGDVVLRYARQMLLLNEDAVAALSLGDDERGKVSVSLAVNADSLATWFLEGLTGLPAELGVVFDLRREDQENTTSLLRSGSVMAAVTSTPDAVQGCTSERLGIMRYHAVCSPGFVEEHLGGTADAARLGGTPVVSFDRGDDLQDRFLRDTTGRAPDSPRHLIPGSADVATAVLLGFGWGLLPEQQCRAGLGTGRLVGLAPDRPVDVRLYWQRWNLRSPLLDAISTGVRSAAAARLHPL